MNDADIEMAEITAAANAAAGVQGGTDVLTTEERDYVVSSAADAGWYGLSVYEAVTYGLHDVAGMRAPKTESGALGPHAVKVTDEVFVELFFAAADKLQKREQAEEAEMRAKP